MLFVKCGYAHLIESGFKRRIIVVVQIGRLSCICTCFRSQGNSFIKRVDDLSSIVKNNPREDYIRRRHTGLRLKDHGSGGNSQRGHQQIDRPVRPALLEDTHDRMAAHEIADPHIGHDQDRPRVGGILHLDPIK